MSTPTPNPIPNVLVVNDDPGSLIGLAGLLNQWEQELGFDTFSARSGEEALRHVLMHDFAVILLDVNMPGMSGFETADAIHSRHASATTPIIFVTAYSADEMNRLKGYEQGAVDYLFTPIVPEILKAKLAVFVALAKSKLALKQQAEALDRKTRELTATNERLQREISKRQIAEEKNKTTEAFLAMLGHELRNPLSAISSAATLLGLDGISMQKAATAKQIIQRQSGQLTRIVDDLLDLSRVMSGRIVLAKQPVDFAALIHNCVETLKIAGRTESYRIGIEASRAWIDADAARMEQVVVNLIDNALKYTPAGGRIDIRLRLDGDEIFFTVRDDGIGMSAELLPRIFDVFVQGERTLDRPQGGLGIGLSLVQQLVQLHGGEIGAASAGLGQGSEITVRLPRSMREQPLADAAGVIEHRRRRVLLIEDNIDGRDIMAMRLAALGHQVYTAENGPAGIAIATREMPDVVLLDIGLPEMDGFAVARALRANPQTCGLKLIALTGYGLEEDRIRSLEAGFDMHLVKPVDQDRLMKALSLGAGKLEEQR